MTTIVEYALIALIAGAVVAQAVAAREVARLAKAAEMIYSLLYYEGGLDGWQVEAAAQQPAPQQPAAQPAAEGASAKAQAPQQGGDECVMDLMRRYGCMAIADVKLKCGVNVRALARMRKEGKIMITRDNKVCPK
jgi:hypothetical protein